MFLDWGWVNQEIKSVGSHQLVKLSPKQQLFVSTKEGSVYVLFNVNTSEMREDLIISLYIYVYVYTHKISFTNYTLKL